MSNKESQDLDLKKFSKKDMIEFGEFIARENTEETEVDFAFFALYEDKEVKS